MTPKTLQSSYNASNFERNHLKGKLGSIKALEATISDKESLVSEAYNQAWLSHCRGKKIPASVLRVCNCDAYWVGKFNVLVEYKYDIDMENPVERAKVIAQVVAYYRNIANAGKVKSATVVFVADVNECFALHVNYLNKFVNLDGVNWKLAPSKMGEDPVLTNALIADTDLHARTVVFNTADPDFSEEKIFNTINSLAEGVTRIVPITEGTVKMGFEYFSTKIIDRSKFKGKANELVGMYFDFIKNDTEKCHINGNKLYFAKYGAVPVNTTKADQFRSRFGVFSENDKRELERMYDTLVSDTERRFNGQFFTPKVWVDTAHRYMAKTLGEDWESSVPTWDCCCGTKSLTRDYEFGELFLSTLEQSELNASENLSTEAVETFKMDFLNDCMENIPDKLKKTLKKAKNGKFAIIINPPYGQAGNGNNKGISNTLTLADMTRHGLAKPGQELTVQFLWRIMGIVKAYELKDVTLGLFSKPTWMTGDAFEDFRKEWEQMATYESGFAFHSEEFEGLTSGWAIHFSVWKLSA